jgi:hypothetical protein
MVNTTTTGVYSFHWPWGRHGTLSGCFVADNDQIEWAIGRDAFFGSPFGKYSEIYGVLRPEHIRLITDDPAIVAIFREHGDIGYNPIDYTADEAGDDD